MRMILTQHLTAFTLALALVTAAGCGDKSKPADPHAGHKHGPGEKHHDDEKGGPGHGGKVIALGEGTFGSYKVKATRDEGQIKAGGDAPIDVWVDPAGASAPKVTGIRFWIGSEDAKGSVKAKADIEDPKDPNRWHTHAEIPDPLAADAKLFVEIEDEKGAKTVASFDLKK